MLYIMSQRKIFRSPLSSGDEHGVTDLLREVSQRSCSLTDEERKEVSDIVKRVEEHAARGTPIGKFKKKLKEIKVGSISISKKDVVDDDDLDDDLDVDDFTNGSSSSAVNTQMNKWGKDLIQKFSNLQTIQNPLASDDAEQQQRKEHAATSKLDTKDVFRNFSLKGIQNPLKPTPSAGREEGKIMKALEQSSQSGRELLRNLSQKIQIPSSPASPFRSSASAEASDSSNIARDLAYPPTIVALPQKK